MSALYRVMMIDRVPLNKHRSRYSLHFFLELATRRNAYITYYIYMCVYALIINNTIVPRSHVDRILFNDFSLSFLKIRLAGAVVRREENNNNNTESTFDFLARLLLCSRTTCVRVNTRRLVTSLESVTSLVRA